MATFQEAPPLPRAPTLIRNDAPHGTGLAELTDPLEESLPPSSIAPPKRPPKDLPLPPRFPSIKDVTAWPDSSPKTDSQPLPDVAWNRTSAESIPASSPSVSTLPNVEDPPEEPPKQSFFAKILAMFKKKKSAAIESPVAQTQPPTKPAIVKAKEAICKLPDPTLVFVLEASVILLIHALKPHILRTWPARLITPLILVPTVIATALWRRTTVIAVPGRQILSVVKPIPNAGKVVSMGESLRARETALLEAEDNLRKGQMKLEVLRKEIEGKLPPQVSIANLLESEANADDDA